MTLSFSSGVLNWGVPTTDVETINNGDIDAEQFRARYINSCMPLLIRSATNHWPAATRWSDPDYLAQAFSDTTFDVHKEPAIELRWRRLLWPDRFGSVFAEHDRGVPSYAVSYDELLKLVASNETVFAYSEEISQTSRLSAIHADVGGFDIVPRQTRPHYYKPVRAFLHGVSYTDWHAHADDSTLFCPFGRSKTVYMLPPDQGTWDVVFGVAKEKVRIGTADTDGFPGLKRLRPRVAVVHPGDALYIPPNWWHAVECDEESPRLGISVAYCWASPLHLRSDPRFPNRSFYRSFSRPSVRLKLAVAPFVWRFLRLAGKTLPEIPGPESRAY